MSWRQKVVLSAAAVFLAAVCAPGARADSITLSIPKPTVTVVPGTTTVEFDETAMNPSMTDTLYLNGDSSTTSSPLVTVDDSNFINNWPVSLAPGASFGPAGLFVVDLPANLAPGTYTGTFSILGDTTNSGGLADLGDVNFSVTVASPVVTPEPATLLLLGAGLAGVCLGRKKTLS